MAVSCASGATKFSLSGSEQSALSIVVYDTLFVILSGKFSPSPITPPLSHIIPIFATFAFSFPFPQTFFAPQILSPYFPVPDVSLLCFPLYERRLFLFWPGDFQFMIDHSVPISLVFAFIFLRVFVRGSL